MTNHPDRLTAKMLYEMPEMTWVDRFDTDGNLIQSFYRIMSGFWEQGNTGMRYPHSVRYVAHVCREPGTTPKVRA